MITHRRAEETYASRRKPRFDLEQKWPRSVRTLYARLRTGHVKELKQYRYLIDQEDDPYCECGMGEETIEHLLCKCPSLERARALNVEGTVSMELMVSDPEGCRRILQTKFQGLKLPSGKTQCAEESTEEVGSPRLHGEPAVTFA